MTDLTAAIPIEPVEDEVRIFVVATRDPNVDVTALQDLPAFRAAIRTAIDRVNADVAVVEKVRQFTFADEPFGIDNEELTPSMKIRRHKIRERYGARIDALYRS